MIVANVMDAIAGEEIEHPAPVAGAQLRALTASVLHVHVEQVQQSNPLGIHVLGIRCLRHGRACALEHRGVLPRVCTPPPRYPWPPWPAPQTRAPRQGYSSHMTST